MRARPNLSFQSAIEPKVAFGTFQKMPLVVFGGCVAPLLRVWGGSPHPQCEGRRVESSAAALDDDPKGVGRHLYSMSCRLRPRNRFHS